MENKVTFFYWFKLSAGYGIRKDFFIS